MSSLTWLLPILAIWPLLRFLKFASLARTVMGLRLGQVRMEGFPYEELPAYFAELAKPDVEELAALGFTNRIAVRVWEAHVPAHARVRVECSNTDGTIRVVIARHPNQIQHAGTRVIFLSTLDSGDELITASYEPERIFPSSVLSKHEALEGAQIPELMVRHGERLAAARAAGINPVCYSLEQGITREMKLSADAVAAFARSGNAATDAKGLLYLRFLPAIRTAREIGALARRRVRIMKAGLKSGTSKPRLIKVSEESQLQFDWETYQFVVALRKGQMSAAAKTILMLASLVLFCLALGLTMSPETVVIIVAALVFHEGGHLLGMRLFGFRDTQLLFLPFLGGVAVGRDAVIMKPWQNLVMLFLGPLPGLFIGIALAAFWPTPTGWVHDLSTMLIFLNAFNLLPFLPLDGGQVMDTVFISRFPFIKVVFMAVSAAALVLIAAYLPGTTLLLALGVFMLMRIPSEWRTASLLREMKREIPPSSDEETTVRRLIRELRKPRWSKTPMMQRIGLASVLQAKLRQPPADWKAILMGLALYTSPVWLGLTLYIGTMRIRSERAEAAAHERAAAAGVVTEVPDYVPKGIAAAENSALPLMEAILLIDKLPHSGYRSASDSVADADSADTSKILSLLHDAAGRAGFEPDPAWLAKTENSSGLVQAVDYLGDQAANRRKLHDVNGTLDVCLDAFRLDRKFQTLPAQWNIRVRAAGAATLWSVVEESLADEPGADPGRVAQLAAQIDLPSYLAYARQAIQVQDAVRRKRVREYQNSSKAYARMGLMTRVMVWLATRAQPGGMVIERSAADQLWGKQALDGIVAGHWPKEKDLVLHMGTSESTSIRVLAVDISRMRMANTALAVCWQGLTTGKQPGSFDEIKVSWWLGIPVHPLSGRPIEWAKARGVGIFSFPPDPAETQQGKDFDEEQSFDPLTWRLPLQK